MSERFDLDTALERLRGKAQTLALSDRDIAIALRGIAASIDEQCEERATQGRKCGHCGKPDRRGICARCFIVGHRFTDCGNHCHPSSEGERIANHLIMQSAEVAEYGQ